MSFKEKWEDNYTGALTGDVSFLRRLVLEIVNILVHIFFR